jgi:hypothetical protein
MFVLVEPVVCAIHRVWPARLMGCGLYPTSYGLIFFVLRKLVIYPLKLQDLYTSKGDMD